MFLLNDRYLFKFTYQYVTFNISQAKYLLKLITLIYWNMLLVQNKLDTRTSMRNSERFIKNRNKNLLSMFKLKDRHFLKFTCPYVSMNIFSYINRSLSLYVRGNYSCTISVYFARFTKLQGQEITNYSRQQISKYGSNLHIWEKC